MSGRDRRTIESVSEFQSSGIRIGDSEREDALGKLGEHMSAGRLDIDEFGERSAQVTTAKTRGELLEIFGDLPEPRPAFGRPAPTGDQVAATSVRAPSVAARVGPVIVPVVAVVLLFALTVVLKLPFIFLLPFVFFAVSNSRRRGYDHRWREHRDALREHHRQVRREWRDKPY
jgi:hypothetical protein